MTMIPNQINVLDPNALASLKRQAKDNSPEAVAGAAKQFEALFLQMVLKSMREATPSDGLTDNDQTRMYQGMLDQQLAQNLSQQGGMGLARALVRQLGGATGSAASETSVGTIRPGTDPATVIRQPARSAEPPRAAERPAAAEGNAAAAKVSSKPVAVSADTAAKRAFVERLWPHAE